MHCIQNYHKHGSYAQLNNVTLASAHIMPTVKKNLPLLQKKLISTKSSFMPQQCILSPVQRKRLSVLADNAP